MTKEFFLPPKINEDQLYKDIRDHPKALDIKKQIHQFWKRYHFYAPNDFQKNAQIAFYQRWWEMYCGLGLNNLNLSIKTSKRDEGPDFCVATKNTSNIWIEAVAPNPGITADKVPKQKFNKVTEVPKDQFRLRLAQALQDKKDKFHKYHRQSIVESSDICIIAISACALNQYGSTMEFPAPAILSVAAGAGNLALSLNRDDDSFIELQTEIRKNSGGLVTTNAFSLPEFKIISGILYSNVDPVNAPAKPEKTFQLFLNPNANNNIEKHYFDRIEIWESSDNLTWNKKS
ncbi:MAG: hypothetical protein AB8G95_13485 [Anaerolineae bacterium]